MRIRIRFFVAFILGIGWGACHQFSVEPHGIPDAQVLRRVEISGFVQTVPKYTPGKMQFQFAVDQFNQKPARALMLLTCYQHCPSDLKLGQYWVLTAKISKPRDYANPGGFHYVRWLAIQHIKWIGTLQAGKNERVMGFKKPHPILDFREHLAKQLTQLGLQEHALGVVQALSLGMTTNLDQTLWDLFRQTGTTHLMVISGAHIGLIAGLLFSMTKWIWSRSERLCLYFPAQQAGAFMGILSAILYAIIAGFAVPAQRSVIACCVMLSRYFLNQQFSTWQAWRCALLLVLMLEPHAVFLPGFYLSFMAVAILVCMSQWFGSGPNFPFREGFRYTKYLKIMGLQLSCLIGLMPFTLFWFSYGAVNGFFANLIAIPWVSFVIVPLALMATILGQWFSISWIVGALNYTIRGFLWFLHHIDSFSMINLRVTYPDMLYPLASLVAIGLLFLCPLRQYAVVLGMLAFVGFFPKHQAVKWGEAKVDILDVGQGLAVAVHTAKHHLIYDTGVKFYHGSDMGKMVMIPYLKTLGVNTLDKVVISHPDLDHRGGLSSLAKAYVMGELIADNAERYDHALSCHTYPDWDWDGVNFHFFQIKNDLNSKNNTSCVLQIKTQKGSMLLTGDIEKKAERYLLKTYGKALQSTTMLVPHHGSNTSSTDLFLATIHPRDAILSYGFDNRYHLPHANVIARYQALNIGLFDTVSCGMLTVWMRKEGVDRPLAYRFL